jgi:hypothetical protein
MIPEITLGGFGILILIGILISLFKKLGLPSRFLPLLAILGGIGLGLGAYYFSAISLIDALVGGAVIGASVSGIYDFGKKTILGN